MDVVRASRRLAYVLRHRSSGRLTAVIRNVVVGRLVPGAERADAEKALAAIVALEPEGCLEMKVGVDAGLREGNWDYSITADFTDVGSYQRYDFDDEHNRIRRELFAPISEQIVRIQFEV